MEALGVVASAAQLAAYGMSILIWITNIYDRIDNAPLQYRQYHVQLKLLVHIAGTIEETSALQIPDVQYHLDAIVDEVRALQSILCSPASGFTKASGVWRYWILIKGEQRKQISVLLDRLNLKYSGLLLCISTVNTVQLSSVQGSVGRVEKLLEMNHAQLQITKEREKKVATLLNTGNIYLHAPDTPPSTPPENDCKDLVLLPSQQRIPPTYETQEMDTPQYVQIPGNCFDSITVSGRNAYVSNGRHAPVKPSPDNEQASSTPNHTATTGDYYKRIEVRSGKVHNGDLGLYGSRYGIVDIKAPDEGTKRVHAHNGALPDKKALNQFFMEKALFDEQLNKELELLQRAHERMEQNIEAMRAGSQQNAE